MLQANFVLNSYIKMSGKLTIELDCLLQMINFQFHHLVENSNRGLFHPKKNVFWRYFASD